VNTPREHFSEEILNAYIDGELGPEESSHIAAAMKQDDLLKRRVYDLKKISELVRAAFEDVSPPVRERSVSPTSPGTRYWRAAAAAMFVSLGVLLSWHMYEHNSGTQISGSLFIADNAHEPSRGQAQAQDLSTAGMQKVMFHIGRNDADLFNMVLEETDRLLSRNGDPVKPIAVSIVASHGGLSLFQLALQDHGQRVRDIKLKHGSQVYFVGCGETLQQMDLNNPVKKTALFPEMDMVDSGVMELLRRQQRGWTIVFI
jgi:intracellular sulfur oxidation DsrE/DsrF family protein